MKFNKQTSLLTNTTTNNEMESIAKCGQQINNSNALVLYSQRIGQRALEAILHSNIAYIDGANIHNMCVVTLVNCYVHCSPYITHSLQTFNPQY